MRPKLSDFFFLSPFGFVVYIVIREDVNSVDKQFGVFTTVHHLESDLKVDWPYHISLHSCCFNEIIFDLLKFLYEKQLHF